MTDVTEITKAWLLFVDGDDSKHSLLHSHFYQILKDSIYLNGRNLPIEKILEIKHDAVMDTLSQVLKHPGRIHLNGYSSPEKYKQLSSYLIGAAKKKATTYYKKAVREQGVSIELEDYLLNQIDEIRPTEKRFDDVQRNTWLTNAIKEELSPEQRIVISLRRVGWKFQDIADVLGIKLKAAQDRERRAKAKLKRRAERDFGT